MANHLATSWDRDLENPELRERELKGLAEAGKRFPEAKRTLLVDRWPVGLGEVEGVAVVPLWRFLLGEWGDGTGSD